MRLIITVVAIMTMSASNLIAAETAAQKESTRITRDIGRYQLFQGTYTTLDLKYRQASSTHNAVFLLDTATGQVKRFVNRIDEDGRYIETWLPTEIAPQTDSKKSTSPQQPEGKTDK